MTARNQTILSVVASFTFYFIWAWYANRLDTPNQGLLLRGALLQGSYSAFMTLTFTKFLSWVIKIMKCQNHPFLALIPPLMMQSLVVFSINYFNNTANIMLTIAPSIFFTALYGGAFSYSLLQLPEYQCDTKQSK